MDPEAAVEQETDVLLLSLHGEFSWNAPWEIVKSVREWDWFNLLCSLQTTFISNEQLFRIIS